MDPTSSGRSAAAYAPTRGTLPNTPTTPGQALVGPLGPPGRAALR